MKIELNCAQCGGNRFDYPFNLRDDSLVTCADCGHEVGMVADLKQKVIEQLNNQKAILPAAPPAHASSARRLP